MCPSPGRRPLLAIGAATGVLLPEPRPWKTHRNVINQPPDRLRACRSCPGSPRFPSRPSCSTTPATTPRRAGTAADAGHHRRVRHQPHPPDTPSLRSPAELHRRALPRTATRTGRMRPCRPGISSPTPALSVAVAKKHTATYGHFLPPTTATWDRRPIGVQAKNARAPARRARENGRSVARAMPQARRDSTRSPRADARYATPDGSAATASSRTTSRPTEPSRQPPRTSSSRAKTSNVG